ncbi:MAG: hypothetical protein AAFO69_17715, partial [Bacteroidota bacterium]
MSGDLDQKNQQTAAKDGGESTKTTHTTVHQKIDNAENNDIIGSQHNSNSKQTQNIYFLTNEKVELLNKAQLSQEELEKTARTTEKIKKPSGVSGDLFVKKTLKKTSIAHLPNEEKEVFRKITSHRFIILESPYDELNDKWLELINEKVVHASECFSLLASLDAKTDVFHIIGQRPKKPESVLIVVYLELQYISQLGSLLSGHADRRYTQSLEDRNQFVVFLLNSGYAPSSTQQKHFKQYTHSIYHQLNFTKILLSEHRIALPSPEEQFRIVESQRKIGLWGNPQDKNEFYREIKSVSTKLDEEIKLRQEFNKEDYLSVQAFIEERLKRVRARDIVPDEDNLTKLLLFVGAYFQNLTLHDFNRLLIYLIRCKEAKLIEKAKRDFAKKSENKKKKKKKGKNKKEDKPSLTYSYLEDWEDRPRQLMEDAILHLSSYTHSEVVEFKYPYLREDLQLYFERVEFVFFDRCFQDLKDSTLVGQQHPSSAIVNGFVSLVARMASKDEINYGINVLYEVVQKFKDQLLHQFNQESNDLEAFQRRQKSEEMIDKNLVPWLTDLMDEMLEIPHLHKTVTQFLNELLEGERLSNFEKAFSIEKLDQLLVLR